LAPAFNSAGDTIKSKPVISPCRANSVICQIGRASVTVAIGAICLRANSCLPSFIPGASIQW
jgi:hypothetical protein